MAALTCVSVKREGVRARIATPARSSGLASVVLFYVWLKYTKTAKVCLFITSERITPKSKALTKQARRQSHF